MFIELHHQMRYLLMMEMQYTLMTKNNKVIEFYNLIKGRGPPIEGFVNFSI